MPISVTVSTLRSNHEPTRVAASIAVGTENATTSSSPPSASHPVPAPALRTAAPTWVPARPPLLANPIPWNESPKSPCSPRQTNFAYSVVTGRSTPSRWSAWRIIAGVACCVSMRKFACSCGIAK